MTAQDPSAPIRIVVMEGDGIGPEITAATMEVVRAVDADFKLGLSFAPVAIGLAALKIAIGGSDLPMSALAYFADPSRASREVREVPSRDICYAANLHSPRYRFRTSLSSRPTMCSRWYRRKTRSAGQG